MRSSEAQALHESRTAKPNPCGSSRDFTCKRHSSSNRSPSPLAPPRTHGDRQTEARRLRRHRLPRLAHLPGRRRAELGRHVALALRRAALVRHHVLAAPARLVLPNILGKGRPAAARQLRRAARGRGRGGALDGHPARGRLQGRAAGARGAVDGAGARVRGQQARGAREPAGAEGGRGPGGGGGGRATDVRVDESGLGHRTRARSGRQGRGPFRVHLRGRRRAHPARPVHQHQARGGIHHREQLSQAAESLHPAGFPVRCVPRLHGAPCICDLSACDVELGPRRPAEPDRGRGGGEAAEGRRSGGRGGGGTGGGCAGRRRDGEDRGAGDQGVAEDDAVRQLEDSTFSGGWQ